MECEDLNVILNEDIK